jgi:hypothetical protein
MHLPLSQALRFELFLGQYKLFYSSLKLTNDFSSDITFSHSPIAPYCSNNARYSAVSAYQNFIRTPFVRHVL